MAVTGICDSKPKVKPEPTLPLTSTELPMPPAPIISSVADPVRLELNTAVACELNRLEPTKRMVPPNVCKDPSVTWAVAAMSPLRYIAAMSPLRYILAVLPVTDRSSVSPARALPLTSMVPDEMIRVSPGCGAPVGDQSLGLDA